MSLFAVILFVLMQNLVNASGDGEWSYSGPHGVRYWCSIENSSCCGHKQSPINLDSRAAYYDHIEPFELIDYYRTPEKMEMFNNGHTVEVTIEDEDLKPRIRGGGLGGEYIFQQFHFHWGDSRYQKTFSPGSEHTINDKRYPMELHLVHYNSKFSSITEALESGQRNAIAVLGVMYDYTYNSRSSAIGSLVQQFSGIKYEDDQVELESPFPLAKLLPSGTYGGFYRYWGSLTTPTCDEVVVWTVFVDPKYASFEQLEAFTKLYTTPEETTPAERMVNNYRPLQQINSRRLWKLNSNRY